MGTKKSSRLRFNRTLPREFYLPSAEVVAPQLLGHWLVRRTEAGLCGGMIVESEAYLCGDPACHAFRGETLRNRSMWGPPGRAYVYLIYGFYHCFNAVCREAGAAEAVLVRAVQPDFGVDPMMERRATTDLQKLTSGPGKLCVAMDIDRSLDGSDLFSADSPVFIAENPKVDEARARLGAVVRTTRIGIREGADLHLRYYLDGSPFVSRKIRVGRGHRRGP